MLLDVTPLTLGIETLGGVFTQLITRGTTIPAEKSQIFSTAQDNQSAVDIRVFEGQRSMVKDNNLLGNFRLDGISPAPRGQAQIEVKFKVDTDGIMTIAAEDKASGKSESVTIKNEKGRLSQEEIDRMIKEAEMYAEQDKLAKDKIDAKNGLEQTIYSVKSMVEDDKNKDKISEDDKKDVLDKVEDVEKWITSNMDASKEEYENKVNEFRDSVKDVMQKMGPPPGQQGDQGQQYDPENADL